MKKRILIGLIIAAIIALLFASCGHDRLVPANKETLMQMYELGYNKAQINCSKALLDQKESLQGNFDGELYSNTVDAQRDRDFTEFENQIHY